ncbi:max-like protein X isoform X4 [Prionailurus viverrinus]|uniref:max-like protein X isoform X4 n=1 Tax=Prionailurus viverrinus TaxID=61388 RepID=UPI001FF29E71|nr:max-like protein X isoform X4 [Prionailurus viverrinus]
MRGLCPALRPSFVGWWVWVTWKCLASSSRQGARPLAGFRFGGSEMTEPVASPDDPWVKVEYAYSDNSLDPDDEDSDYHQESYKESYKDRRRRAHTQAEQKRRDAIKRGYDDLQTIVPTCQQQDFSIGSQKLSKAIILQKTIDYIQFLHKEKKKQEEEVSMLRKDVTALKIMKVNYEQIVKAHQDNPHEGEDQVSDQVKFNVFQGIMDSLFQSFNASISVASFQELSACVFSWIEEHCKPQTLREIVIGVLHQLKNQLY